MTTDSHNPSDQELEAIAYLVARSRPEWPAGVTLSVLRAHRLQVDAADLAIAALRAARTPDFRTPKTIGWRGPHWAGLATVVPDAAPRKRCRVCGKTEDRCETQRVGLDDDHDFEPVELRAVRRAPVR